ncbi:carboxyltransferase domain-containing protein [Streptomyces sp. NBC_00726]|uniref:carboxyltransferase domain-containing protein n=1 Tax=Streptomyces sp. NBC_00726 TaxID=2903674 RepID=UPI0038669323
MRGDAPWNPSDIEFIRRINGLAGVGIGGSYLCVYGMESPGGYQLIGRTVPVRGGLRPPRAPSRSRPPEAPSRSPCRPDRAWPRPH